MCVACNSGIVGVLEFMASRRTVLQTGALLAASVWLPPARAQGRTAELLFRNGTVLTMDPARPRAQSVAVSGGKIMAVGSGSEVEGLRTSQSKGVDLGGGRLLPPCLCGSRHAPPLPHSR